MVMWTITTSIALVRLGQRVQNSYNFFIIKHDFTSVGGEAWAVGNVNGEEEAFGGNNGTDSNNSKKATTQTPDRVS